MASLNEASRRSPATQRRRERQHSVEPAAGEQVLVGRERERAMLATAAASVRAGRGTCVLVNGEAGIGKTSLIRQVLAESGLLLLEGRAHLGFPLPYGPLVMALRGLATEPLLARFQPATADIPQFDDRATLFEALRAALVAVAQQQPAALFLDDLHWADHATLELLPALAGALVHESLLIVGAYRSDEIPRSHPVRRLRADLRQAGRLQEVTLGPLTAQQTARVASRLLGEPPSPTLVTALHARSEGVPFFVEELAVALAASGRLQPGATGLTLDTDDDLPLPESIRDAVGVHMEGLPPLARRLLDLAAVAGQECDIELLFDLGDATEEDLTPLLERRLLLDEGTGRITFRHALTREACYLDMPWTRRRALHRELASALAARGAPSALVAEHWLAGREHERACAALVAAAEASCRSHAYRDALVAYRRALEIWPDTAEAQRHDVLERLAACAERSGDLTEAMRAWRDAAAVHRDAGDMYAAAAAERRLAAVAELRGDWERSLAARAVAAATYADLGLPGEAATERLLAAAHLRAAATYHAALELLAIARAEAERAGRVDLLARILAQEGNARARLGDDVIGLELVRSGLSLALEHKLPDAAGEIYQRLADALEHAGDYASARETYMEAFHFCQTNATDTVAYICLACLSVVLRQTGEWDRAVTICRDVLASPEPSAHARAVASGTLGAVYALRGDARAARPLLAEGMAVAQRIELAAMELLSTWGLALVDDLRGSPDAALARCRDLLARWERTEERHYVVPVLRWAATYCAEHDAEREARACAAALAGIATDTGQPEALSALAHALGEIALLDGAVDQAVTQFAQALDLLRDQQVPFDQATTERRAGHALVLAGQRDAGVARLTSAYRTARKLGARPLSACIATDLQTLGEPVERRLGRRAAARLSNAGLSPRELDVLQLVAVGRTSREIGQQLFLSHRTVEMHVQSILGKLDCRTRADATRRAAELGLLSSVTDDTISVIAP
jgi:predicted ATPase/DNA-binding NarL/FixJ family response regulator